MAGQLQNIFRGNRDFNWIAVILTPLAIILMEMLCFYPWLISAGKWTGLFPDTPPLSAVSAIILTALGLISTRFFTAKIWLLWKIRLCIIACALIAIAATAGIEYATNRGAADTSAGLEISRFIIAAVAGLFFWWRGMSWGLSQFDFNKIYRLFMIGLFALILLALVWGASPGDQSPVIGIYIGGFFFCSLMALSLSKLQSIQEQVKARGKEAFTFSRQWTSIVVIIAGITVVLGITAAGLFSIKFSAILTGFLSKASDLLLGALYYIMIPVGFLINAAVNFLRFIISFLQTGQSPQPAFSDNLTAPPEFSQIFTVFLSPEATAIIKWSLFALLLVGVLWFLYRTVYRTAVRKEGENADEIHESLWSRDGFVADLRLFLNNSIQQFRDLKKQLPRKNAFPHPREDESGKLDIREIYRRLLWKAAEIKLARRQQETPLEYAGRLGVAMPESSPQLRNLTYLYDSVRYGDIKPDFAEVEYANGIWAALQESIDKISENQKASTPLHC